MHDPKNPVRPPRRGRREAEPVLENLDPGRVFYYPACEVDWSPLFRFTHDCDTFIFADWRMDPERFRHCLWEQLPNTWVGRGLAVRDHEPISAADWRFLAEARSFTRDQPPNPVVAPCRDSPQTWGEKVHLVRTVAGRPRHLTFLYLRAEGLSLYHALFASRGRAPRYLCLKRCGGGLGGGWTNFNIWREPFGRLVEKSGARPEFLVNEGTHDWPDYRRVWHQAPYWRLPHTSYPDSVKVYRRADLPAPARTGEPVTYTGRRTVQVLDRPLLPEHCQPGELMVLTDGMRVSRRPADNPFVLVRTQAPAMRTLAASVVPLVLPPRRPMEAILADLTRIAAANGIGAIRAGGFGFEDEAACLRAWADGCLGDGQLGEGCLGSSRLGDGGPAGLRLTLHAEHPGDCVLLRNGLMDPP